MRAKTTFLAIMLVTAVLSVVAAQKVVPPGQIGKVNTPPGQMRRQFTYGHMKEWVPLLAGIIGCLSTLCCCGIGGPIGYLLGNACIRPNL